MNALKATLAAATIGLSSIATSAVADNVAAVKAFYNTFTNPSEESRDAFRAVVSDDWKSYGNYSGTYETSEDLLSRNVGIADFMPDLEFTIEGLHEAGNFITVRSRAKATPAGKFLGIDPQGPFDIMNIDIHEVKDGKLVNLWHIEDWATAMRQMSGQ
jgi:predicted ester cyclase